MRVGELGSGLMAEKITHTCKLCGHTFEYPDPKKVIMIPSGIPSCPKCGMLVGENPFDWIIRLIDFAMCSLRGIHTDDGKVWVPVWVKKGEKIKEILAEEPEWLIKELEFIEEMLDKMKKTYGGREAEP